MKSKNGSGSMLATTVTARSSRHHSSAAVAAPAASNHPRNAITRTGSRKLGTESQSASSTSSIFIASFENDRDKLLPLCKHGSRGCEFTT